MTHNRTTKPVSEILATLRELSTLGVKLHPENSFWDPAAHFIRKATEKLAYEAKFKKGQWILVNDWREHQAQMARAIEEIGKAKRMADIVLFGLHEQESGYRTKKQHIESALRAIDELQRHPRFASLPTHTPATEIQPA